MPCYNQRLKRGRKGAGASAKGRPTQGLRTMFKPDNGAQYFEIVKKKEGKGMSDKHVCSVCGQSECDEYDEFSVCPVCGWGYDCLQEDYPDYCGGFNKGSLNQARAAWKEKQNKK